MNRRSTNAPLSTDHVVREIEYRMRTAYGQPRHGNPSDPLDDLIFIVLSRMTQEIKYTRSYNRVRRALSTWDAVREASPDELELLIHDAGLAPTKAVHIQAILDEIQARESALNLHRLRSMADDAVERYLTSLPGVARKTALCVMLYGLGRNVLPVDTHVWRVAQRLGLVAPGNWSEARGRVLESRVPVDLRSSLHITMIAHGRQICRAPVPSCRRCVLADLCPTASTNLQEARLPPEAQPE